MFLVEASYMRKILLDSEPPLNLKVGRSKSRYFLASWNGSLKIVFKATMMF